MKLHYISDGRNISNRKLTPVHEWNALKPNYEKVEGRNTFEIPQWQKDIVLKRLKDYENGIEEYLEFEHAIKEIEKDL
ncbi:hypothetical protein [Dyadobacter luticola]|uniref:Addiction module protein n=1 Tax=Dyadobacter luticola TaxID=1979387 RepID=A0A5R9KPJ0_9BACT|nr:hypothetical protein [Dyadobacter luticola]TLU98143.1 hypothetical protein FEN17_25540 [Dyadobacter luticola]